MYILKIFFDIKNPTCAGLNLIFLFISNQPRFCEFEKKKKKNFCVMLFDFINDCLESKGVTGD